MSFPSGNAFQGQYFEGKARSGICRQKNDAIGGQIYFSNMENGKGKLGTPCIYSYRNPKNENIIVKVKGNYKGGDSNNIFSKGDQVELELENPLFGQSQKWLCKYTGDILKPMNEIQLLDELYEESSNGCEDKVNKYIEAFFIYVVQDIAAKRS